MMVYRKGELSPTMIDRGWPHQVALPASALLKGGYQVIHDFCRELSLCARGHSVCHEGMVQCVLLFRSWLAARNSIRGIEERAATGRKDRR